MLEVRNLKKAYGDRKILDDVSFSTEKGRIYGFLGPNGTGKSTTMNLITGYLSPGGGDILINEISMIKNPARAKKHIGYLPEQPPLYPDLTVSENLDFAAELKGITGSTKKKEMARVSELAGLSSVQRHMIKQISKGYKQRVALAQALLGDPELIILDEPSSGLDPRQIVEMRELVRQLGREHTVIFSTHSLSEVENLCDHILMLYGGKLVADDTPDELVRKHNDRQRIRLVIRGNSTKADAAMEKNGRIESHRILREDAESCTIEVTAFPGQDIRESISKTCMEEGYGILEMVSRQMNLEEVYLKLTGADYALREDRDESGI